MPLYPSLSVANIVELFKFRSQTQPFDIAYEFFSGKGMQSQTINYLALSQKVHAIAQAILEKGVRPGDRALLIFPPGLDLIAAFYACFHARVIAVLVYPPMNEKLINKLNHVIKDAEPAIFLSTTETKIPLAALFNTLPEEKTVCTDEVNEDLALSWEEPIIHEDDLAILQYTSGSTNLPRGVKVSHKNFLSNMRLSYEGANYKSIKNFVSWLPPYHDMGLMMGILSPLFCGVPARIISPMHFILNPINWLNLVSKYDAVLSGGPNFSFNYCISKISDEQKKGLDLSQWFVCINGAEPIHSKTIDNFVKSFSPCGFSINTFYPAYGLAEATLLVSVNNDFNANQGLSISTKALKKNQIKIVKKPGEDNKFITSVGKMYQEMIIADPETKKQCKDDCIGEIWIHSDSVCQGYWNKPEETERMFAARLFDDESNKTYLRTGDLGFIHASQLYIIGRIKDLIIIHGQNYLPQDIEYAVECSHPWLKHNCSIAFSIEQDKEEKLVIVCGTKPVKDEKLWADLVDAICKEISKEYELAIYSIAFISPALLPKTTSGKVQRQACKNLFVNGKLAIDHLWEAPKFDENKVSISDDNIDIEAWIMTWLSLHLKQDVSSLNPSKSFIEYGLDSINIANLVHEISEHCGLSLNPMIGWDYPTPREIAQYISSHYETLPKLEGIAIPVEQALQLSLGQECLWFVQQMSPDSTLYNTGCAYKFTTAIDVEKLKKACDRLLQRHHVLRTAISIRNGKPIPIILPKLTSFFSVVNYEERTGSIIDELRHETMRPYDLSKGNLIRFVNYQINENESILLVAAHHIIIDGWSVQIVLRELLNLYDNYEENDKASILQYYDVIHWQNKNLEADYKNANDYWISYLSEAPHNSTLPFDKPRQQILPNIQSYNLKLDRDIYQKINSFCEEEGITLFILFFTAYQLLISRYSAQKDLVIGTPVSGRTFVETRSVIGYFVNTLPIRLQVDSEQKIKDLLQKNQATITACLRHQSIPLGTLLSQLHIERHLFQEPLFQLMFVMHNNYQDKITADRVGLSFFWVEASLSTYDLVYEVLPRDDGFEFIFKYNQNLFSEETIESLAAHLQLLLSGIISRKEEVALKIPLLSEDEQHKIVSWNQDTKDYGKVKTVHELFEQQVLLTPKHCALIVDSQSITYQELNEQSNKLAHYLHGLHFSPNSVIAVSQPRSLDLVISFLAILKSGFTFLYLDPEFPNSRLFEMLAQSKAKIVLNELNWQDYHSQPKSNLALHIDEHQLAYIISTSGSTGRPKTVMIEHGGLADHLSWYRTMPINVDRLLHSFSFNFDAAIAALFWPLIMGKTVVMPGNIVGKKEAIDTIIFNEKITALHLTPSLMEGFLSAKKSNFSTVKDIVLAGESFNKYLDDKIKDFFNNKIKVWNFYGVSECSIVSCAYLVTHNEGKIIPIGKPIPNVQCYILDEYQNPLPVRAIGELYIGGVGVGPGYMNEPELTAAKFINVSLGRKTTQRVYKTGDLVCWNSKGDIEFIDRIDNQIKRRGYRIELGEIQANLLQMKGITEAVVLIRKNSLVAYIVSEVEFDSAEVKDFLAKKLPGYMIPDSLVFLEKLPLTKSGKIDKDKLPDPQDESEGFERPKTRIEIALVKIWSDLLKIEFDLISINDDFFEVGGDSILGIQFIFLCKKEGYNLTPEDLFKCHTIKKIVKKIESKNTMVNGKKVGYILGKLTELFDYSKNISIEGYENIPHKKPLIIASNHLHWWEMMQVNSMLLNAFDLSRDNTYVLSAKPLKLFDYFIRHFLKPVYLTRKQGVEDSKAMETCISLLKKGKSILLSPEGGRGANRGSIRAKNGAVFLAIHSNVTLLPIAIYKEKKPTKFKFFKKSNWIIKIGQEIKINETKINKDSLQESTNKLMQAISKLGSQK